MDFALPRFTNRALHAIRAARELAGSHGRSEATTAELLASVLRIPNSFATAIVMKLAHWGIVTLELEQLIRGPRIDGADSLNSFLANLPDDPSTIGTEHLLEEIIAAASGDWARQLSVWGLDAFQTRKRRRDIESAQQAQSLPCEACRAPASFHICTVDGDGRTSNQHFASLVRES